MLVRHESRKALGSTIDIVLVARATEERLTHIFTRLWLIIFRFEKCCSRFLPASELSALNRGAGVRTPISAEFRRALLAARSMADLSGGLYNPFMLPALQRAGYVQSLASHNRTDPVDDFSNRAVTSAMRLEIGEDWARIPYGAAIDLGGCGKGLVGDMLAEAADDFSEVQGYWFSVGGDIVCAGHDQDNRPWNVQIAAIAKSTSEDAAKPGIAGDVTMPNSGHCAVATSAVTARKGTKNGKAWHHIIDPRTNQPAVSDIVSASVCSSSGLTADVLASCAIILGSSEAQSYLEERNVFGDLLQMQDKPPKAWGAIKLIEG